MRRPLVAACALGACAAGAVAVSAVGDERVSGRAAGANEISFNFTKVFRAPIRGLVVGRQAAGAKRVSVSVSLHGVRPGRLYAVGGTAVSCARFVGSGQFAWYVPVPTGKGSGVNDVFKSTSVAAQQPATSVKTIRLFDMTNPDHPTQLKCSGNEVAIESVE